MAERTLLITGGTGGLGRRAAAELAADPAWHVAITGRDRPRTESAAATLGAEPLVLDLGSLDDVRRFARDLREGERPPLAALICNAGIQHVSAPVLSRDGYESTFAVNHLGHFLLVALLLDRLTPPARVVIVSSGTHDPAQRTGMPSPRYTSAAELARSSAEWAREDPPATAGRRRYTTSKLCNVLFTYELERRLGGGGHHVQRVRPRADAGDRPRSRLPRPPAPRLAFPDARADPPATERQHSASLGPSPRPADRRPRPRRQQRPLLVGHARDPILRRVARSCQGSRPLAHQRRARGAGTDEAPGTAGARCDSNPQVISPAAAR